MKVRVDFSRAIMELKVRAETRECNAPFWEARGNSDQAECSRANATNFREAIEYLKRAEVETEDS